MLAQDEQQIKINQLQDIFTAKRDFQFTEDEKSLLLQPSQKTFLRYLIANRWNVEKAFENIKSTICWRREFKPLNFSEFDKLADDEKGARILR